MTAQVFIPLVLATVLAVYVGIAVRAFYKLRGTRVVVCPETKRPVGVTVDLGHAATSAVWEQLDVRISSCSRWPERTDCDQSCAAQIEADPHGTRAKAMATHFFEGQRCAICQRSIDAPSPARLQPGFMHPDTHEVKAWDELDPANLPCAIQRDFPLCANCTLAESVRQRFPDGVPRPGSTLPR